MKKFCYVAVALLALSACKGRNGQTEGSPSDEEETPGVETVAPKDTMTAIRTAKALPEEPVFDIVTNMGTIKVRLYKNTPRHRDNFEKLALSGYYDSLLFHRVIKDFMIQGGDPFTRDTAKVDLYGQGGPDYTIPAEFVKDEYGLPLYTHKRGALAAARRGDLANPMKESSGSQFYLVQNPDACTHLDGEYTVFGETVAGFNVIDRIAGVRTNRMGLPERDVRILTIKPDAELNKKVENTPAGE